MQSLWSGYPGYTSVQVQDFNRAKEPALITKLSYDFSCLGLESVSSYLLFVHGWEGSIHRRKAARPMKMNLISIFNGGRSGVSSKDSLRDSAMPGCSSTKRPKISRRFSAAVMQSKSRIRKQGAIGHRFLHSAATERSANVAGFLESRTLYQRAIPKLRVFG
jgi:hypothetical protein